MVTTRSASHSKIRDDGAAETLPLRTKEDPDTPTPTPTRKRKAATALRTPASSASKRVRKSAGDSSPQQMIADLDLTDLAVTDKIGKSTTLQGQEGAVSPEVAKGESTADLVDFNKHNDSVIMDGSRGTNRIISKLFNAQEEPATPQAHGQPAVDGKEVLKTSEPGPEPRILSSPDQRTARVEAKSTIAQEETADSSDDSDDTSKVGQDVRSEALPPPPNMHIIFDNDETKLEETEVRRGSSELVILEGQAQHEEASDGSDDDAPEELNSKDAQLGFARPDQSRRRAGKKSKTKPPDKATEVESPSEGKTTETTTLEEEQTGVKEDVPVSSPANSAGLRLRDTSLTSHQLQYLDSSPAKKAKAILKDGIANGTAFKGPSRPSGNRPFQPLVPAKSGGSMRAYMAQRLSGRRMQHHWGGRSAFMTAKPP